MNNLTINDLLAKVAEYNNEEIEIIRVLAQKLWDDYLVLDISNSFKKKYSSSG